MRSRYVLSGVVVAVAVAGCATVSNLPLNQPSDDGTIGNLLAQVRDTKAAGPVDDDVTILLAFSGGGTRAAAFSYGALKELAKTTAKVRGQSVSLLDRVGFLTGVSGGSITAAYFGLKKRAALDDFRERFLIQDAEAALRTGFNLANLSRAVGGGVNEDARLRDWLDAQLFEGKTFGDIAAESRPVTVINATDIYNRIPFIFGLTEFTAICSDLAAYPISAAVAASAAVPVAFAPVVLEIFPDRCTTPLPDWLTRAQKDPHTSPLLRAYALGVQRYRDGSMRYIKLLDGGLADNFGLSGFTIMRESAKTAYGPLSAAQVVKLRRVLFLVIDAGRGPQGNWAKDLDGPKGAELAMAVADSAIDASVRSSYTAFEATMRNWRDAMVRWRCGLPADQVARLRGATSRWSCEDVKFFIGRVAFDQLEPERAARLNAVSTSLKLPVDTVDEVIAAGSDAVARNPAWRAFLRGL